MLTQKHATSHVNINLVSLSKHQGFHGSILGALHQTSERVATGHLLVVKSNSMDADRPLFIAHGLPPAHGEILTSFIVQFGAGAGSLPATQK